MNKRKALSILLPSIALAASSKAQTPRSTPAKTPSEGEKLLSELWAKVYNLPQDLSVIDRVCTEDFILSSAGTDVVGRKAFKEWAAGFSAKIGGIKLVSNDMFSSADGTRVVSRWTVTGTNRGMLGTPADGKPVKFTGIAVWEVRNGKLAHNWVERSAYELWRTLTAGS